MEALDMKPTMMIETTYRGPTDYRQARVTAVNVNTRVRASVPWVHELDIAENHARAAVACRAKCYGLNQGTVTRELDVTAEPTHYSSVDKGGYIFVWCDS